MRGCNESKILLGIQKLRKLADAASISGMDPEEMKKSRAFFWTDFPEEARLENRRIHEIHATEL